MSKGPNPPAPNLPGKGKNLPALLFWACFFFLCGTDRVFSIEWHGLHFRWGQLLLLLAALTSIRGIYFAFNCQPGKDDLPRKILLAWFPFFILYAFSAFLSPFPALTDLKLGWGLFNILGAALVILAFRENQNLFLGFQWGFFLTSSVVWIDSIFLQCLVGPALLGFSQPWGTFEGFQLFRPHGFYYEPSYAGGAMAFALPLLLALSGAGTGASLLINSLVMGSVLLVGSRTGLLGLAVSMTVILACGLLLKKREIWRTALKTTLTALLLLGLFGLTSGGSRYFRFLYSEIAGPQRIYANLTSKTNITSESIRVGGIKKSIEDWKTSPLLGSGVLPDPQEPQKHLLESTLTNTWMELAVESGILGLLAFVIAVGLNMKTGFQRNGLSQTALFVAAAWTTHFAVNLNFTQTFPRLDYWLLFFFSIALLTRQKE